MDWRTHSGWAGAIAVGGLAVLGAGGDLAGQREPSLDDVLARAAAYAVRYGDEMASVIADEDYVQQLETTHPAQVNRRHLVSEIALVRLTDSTEWQSFRDVLSVDGEPVGGEAGRLERIFREAPATVLGQARTLAAESARHNLGPLQRTFNTPTITLQFLHSVHQDRFEFKRRARTVCGDEPCWEVTVKERRGGTLIRTTAGRNVPIDGTLWIAPADGRLMRGRFELRDFLDRRQGLRSHAEIEVRWRYDANVDAWVPAALLERYDWLAADRDMQTPHPVILTGTATYTRYRRFVVDYRIR